jgi:uncharacterized protein
MPLDFLGIGWSFPVEGREGDDASPLSAMEAHYEESVRQAIWIILSTARGERVMRPDFGCGIHSLVFALDNPSTTGLVEHEVEQALLFWEPRINVTKVTVDADRRSTSDPSNLAIEYTRFCETEARRRFHALPHAAKEARRREVLHARAKAHVPATAPEEIDGHILEEIARKELPAFDKWHTERKSNLGPGLFVTIEYTVKATNSRFNVVYPFYLDRRPGLNG